MTRINQPAAENKVLSYAEAKDEFVRVLVRTLQTTPPPLKEYTTYLAASLGKNLRGNAVILSATSPEGTVNEDAIHIAVAIELFHLATLVHDDVIDDSDLRRGIPSLQRKFSKKIAVICGDYLLAKSLEIAAKVKYTEEYQKYSIENYAKAVCLGELRQNYNLFNTNISSYRYFSIIRGKTAVLFEAAFVAGAIIAQEPEEKIAKYRKFGRYLGMIFQMSDDLMDFEADLSEAKKPILSDLKAGIMTLPVIYTINHLSSFKKKIMQGLDPKNLKGDIVKAGGIRYTREVSEKYYAKALNLIGDLELPFEKEQGMIQLLNASRRQ